MEIITLINPNLIIQKSDLFTTGIVYMPIGLASFAATLRQNKMECNVIDAFGEKPMQFQENNNLLIRGMMPDEVVDQIQPNTKAIAIYASNLTYHHAIVNIIKTVRPRFPNTPIILIENSQAVTAYSLRYVQEEFYDIGVDYIIAGDVEDRGIKLLSYIKKRMSKDDILKIDGIGFREKGVVHFTAPDHKIDDLNILPFPAWDLFPLENYWKLKYAHGPFETKRYLPLLTSRGCPYACSFCVIPETNKGQWRFRSPKNMVDEIEAHVNKFGVREFHFEDVNPTVSESRIIEFCKELLERNLNIIWKISAGTKIETIKNKSTIDLMAKAGCKYISFSPESGSPHVLKLMNKPFDIGQAIHLLKRMNKAGIRTQACFVLGFPGETDEDRKMTWNLVRDLTKVGIDEIALFIITPVPGSSIFDQYTGYSDYSELNFSPTWRQDYKILNDFRLHLYKRFLFWKLCYHPLKIIRQITNFAFQKFETKMEMTPYRAFHTLLISRNIIGTRRKNED